MALKPYLDDGWQVQILPWVVGVRGLFITSTATPVFKFLSIPSDCRTELLEETNLESVKALYLLHRTRRHALPPHNRMTDVHGCFDFHDPGAATANGNADPFISKLPREVIRSNDFITTYYFPE